MVNVLKFKPIYKERIWGGRNLERVLGRTLPVGVKIGESWDLADLPEDKSSAACGPTAGRGIDELVRDWAGSLLGTVQLDAGQFPLLVKFLDAQDVLSVQIHPDYETAAEMGGSVRAKYEAWYVLAAGPDSCIYRGFKPGVTRGQVERAIKSNELAELMIKLQAREGDWFYLPGGTVHALGGGLVVAEVQTPSDTTFRLYDWGRVDPKTGKSRDLHIEQGLACLNFDLQDAEAAAGSVDRRSVCRLVEASTFTFSKSFKPAGSADTFQLDGPGVWIILEGTGTIGDDAFRLDFGRGDVILIPAGMERVEYSFDEDCSYLQVDLK